MLRSVGAVLDGDHMDYLRRSHRLAFALDDRDQVFPLRVRLVVSQPRVQAVEFVANVIRDFGYGIDDCASAVWKALTWLCTVQRGLRSSNHDHLDETLIAKVKQVTFCGSSDGCEVAIQGVQKLKNDGFLPNLRYQFRDRPHTTRTITKNVLHHMQGSKDLVAALITGKASFCKRAKHSRRFQRIWIRKQQEKSYGDVPQCPF